MVRNLPAMQETQVQSLSWEDPLENGNGNPLQNSCREKFHGQRGLVGLQSVESQRVGQD